MKLTRQQRVALKHDRDRDRQTARRETLRESGRPLTHAVNSAIVEAMAFHLLASPVDPTHLADASVKVKPLLKTVRAILRRDGYDPEQSRIAIKQRLAPRKDHRVPGFVPSLLPGTRQSGSVECNPDVAA